MEQQDQHLFWNRVYRLMKIQNLRIADVWRISGVDQRTIAKGIKSHSIPRADNALKIADALGVSLRYLLYGKDEQPYDASLSDSFSMIQGSVKASEIAKVVPLLSTDQSDVIIGLMKSWGFEVSD